MDGGIIVVGLLALFAWRRKGAGGSVQVDKAGHYQPPPATEPAGGDELVEDELEGVSQFIRMSDVESGASTCYDRTQRQLVSTWFCDQTLGTKTS